jgi:hypothetical protein
VVKKKRPASAPLGVRLRALFFITSILGELHYLAGALTRGCHKMFDLLWGECGIGRDPPEMLNRALEGHLGILT